MEFNFTVLKNFLDLDKAIATLIHEPKAPNTKYTEEKLSCILQLKTILLSVHNISNQLGTYNNGVLVAIKQVMSQNLIFIIRLYLIRSLQRLLTCFNDFSMKMLVFVRPSNIVVML